MMLKGIAVSDGIGIGNAFVVGRKSLSYENRAVSNIEEELTRYHEAAAKFTERTNAMADKISANTSKKEGEILRGHILMLNDPYMSNEVEKLISSGICAEEALSNVCDSFISIFSSVDDELTSQRAADVCDVKASMLSILLGVEEVSLGGLPPQTVVVAEELTPSMTSDINGENIVGIVTERGGKNSHSSIIARALGIPSVIGVEGAAELLKNGDKVIVDGLSGNIIVSPDTDTLRVYIGKQSSFNEESGELNHFRGKPTVTGDGKVKKLYCNIGYADEAVRARECDGEGIGLFRTELMFLNREEPPTEDEQFSWYKKAALTFRDSSVTIRTLDIGGDKVIPYLGIEKEENPYLGNRAVRYCLRHEDIFRTQLRAILRASTFGKINIMIPLVTGVEELRAVKGIIANIKRELRIKSIEFDDSIKVGIMIETPAAAIKADLLAEEADFFSIGTNDLIQYTMAVDRGNSNVEYLYSPLDPAVIRSIKRIIECAHDAGIPVEMCGEAAADPLMLPLLISFGLDGFSVSPSYVLKTRRNISKWNKESADKIVQQIFLLKTEREIREFIKAELKEIK